MSLDDLILCDSLKEYVLSEEKLIENNYPVRHPEKPGCAVRFVDSKNGTGDRELMLLVLTYFDSCCTMLPCFILGSWCFCLSKLSKGSAVAAELLSQ